MLYLLSKSRASVASFLNPGEQISKDSFTMVQHLVEVLEVLRHQQVGQGGDNDDRVGHVWETQSVPKQNKISNFGERNSLELWVRACLLHSGKVA